MLSFFDSLTSFFSTIWNYIQNLLELTIELYIFLTSTYVGINSLVPFLPSVISLGFFATVAIMLVRFLLMK